MEDLMLLYASCSKTSRSDAMEVSNYVWMLVSEIIKAINQLNKQVRIWKDVAGDFQDLQEEKGALDICTELSLISGVINALGLLNLGGHLEEITQ